MRHSQRLHSARFAAGVRPRTAVTRHYGYAQAINGAAAPGSGAAGVRQLALRSGITGQHCATFGSGQGYYYVRVIAAPREQAGRICQGSTAAQAICNIYYYIAPPAARSQIAPIIFIIGVTHRPGLAWAGGVGRTARTSSGRHRHRVGHRTLDPDWHPASTSFTVTHRHRSGSGVTGIRRRRRQRGRSSPASASAPPTPGVITSPLRRPWHGHRRLIASSRRVSGAHRLHRVIGIIQASTHRSSHRPGGRRQHHLAPASPSPDQQRSGGLPFGLRARLDQPDRAHRPYGTDLDTGRPITGLACTTSLIIIITQQVCAGIACLA